MATLIARNKTIPLYIGLIAMVLLVLFGELPDSTLLWRELQNTGHTLLFAVVAVLILLLIRGNAKYSQQGHMKLYAMACLLSLFVGVSTEMLQLMMLSDASEMDVLRDFAGTVTGLGLYASFDPNPRQHGLKEKSLSRLGIFVLSICVFVVSLLPLAHLSLAYVQREDAFPVVVDLTASWSESFVRYKRATMMRDESKRFTGNLRNTLARVDFTVATYPGFSIIEPHPDWSSYKVLILSIYSQNINPIDLVLRVHDERHNNDYTDRYNRKLKINMGENYFNIPLRDIEGAPKNRNMDMMRIRDITLFAEQLAAPLSIYVDQIRLE